MYVQEIVFVSHSMRSEINFSSRPDWRVISEAEGKSVSKKANSPIENAIDAEQYEVLDITEQIGEYS